MSGTPRFFCASMPRKPANPVEMTWNAREGGSAAAMRAILNSGACIERTVQKYSRKLRSAAALS